MIKINLFGLKKCLVLFVLAYACETSKQMERIIKKSKKNYCTANPRVIFTLSFVLSPNGKDIISNKHKNCVVYTFKCCCSNSYVGQTSRQLETKIKDHIKKRVRDHTFN